MSFYVGDWPFLSLRFECIFRILFIGVSSAGVNIFASDRSCQTDFPKVLCVDQSCQTDFPDISYFRSFNSENVTSSDKSSDLIGSSTTTNTTNETVSDEYQPESEDVSEETSSDKECDSVEDADDIDDTVEDEFDDSDVEDVRKDNRLMCELTMSRMENNLQHYTGINKESSYVVDIIIEESGVSRRDVFLVLRKIRHNETLQILGDSFGISRGRAGKIFCECVKKIAEVLKPFIYWPEPKYIKYNLPLQFKHKFRNVQVIIDCFEISVRKPLKVLDQALTWSSYKHSNTVKYLIAATPDGMIIFISKGFTGRITDTEIIKRSGFLDFIKNNTEVLADRGFKDIAGDIMSKGGILIKPPSTKAGFVYTAEEAKMCKTVAAIRIHIERVIGRIRNFAFLKPQNSLLESNRVYLLEYAVTIASAICNMLGQLTKI